MSILLSACGGAEQPDTEAKTAEAFPTKALTVISPAKAGNAADVDARQLAKALGEIVKQPVNVVVKPGARQAVGLTSLLDATPDGHTLGFFSTAQPETLQKKAGEWRPVAMVSTQYQVMVVKADSPYQTLEDFLEAADSGDAKMGLGSFGSPENLNIGQLEERAKVKISTVTTEGIETKIRSLLAGTLDAIAGGPPALVPLIEAGTIRPLAVFGPERASYAPDVPTVTELGYGEDYLTVDNMVIVSADVPDATVTTLSQQIEEATQSDSYQTSAKKAGLLVNYMDPNELEGYLKTKFEHATELASKYAKKK